MLDLSGRRLLITGASSGIGLAVASQARQAGATIVMLARDAARLAAAKLENGGEVVVADVRDPIAATEAVAAASAILGGLDGVICAAGVNIKKPVETITDQIWADVIATNLSGTFYICRAAVPFLRATLGPTKTIVTVGTGGALLPPGPNLAAYAASKGGVISMTKALARELAPAIRVNAVLPGNAATPLTEAIFAEMSETERETALSSYALGRLADPAEIARAILFLTSAVSSYVVGTSFSVDGGRIYH